MTATETRTTGTLSSPPPTRPPTRQLRVIATAAGLIAFAAVVLTSWLLINNSQTETSSPVTPILAAVSPQQVASVSDQLNADRNAGAVGAPTAYVMFCENSPALCSVPPAPALSNAAYLQFCWNSPTLCTAPKHN